MSSTKIDPIERISILCKLINRYCTDDTYTLSQIIILAKDLAKVIDELRKRKIDSKTFEDNFTSFFPAHWKERTRFLKIVTTYWPDILSEIGKLDVDLPKMENRNENLEQADNLLSSISLEKLSIYTKKITTFEAEDILAEVDFVVDTLKQNQGKSISIVVPNNPILKIIHSRFKLEKFTYTSYVDNVNEKLPQEFLEKINENFPVNSEEEQKKLIDQLSEFALIKKLPSNISLVNFSQIDFKNSDLIVLTAFVDGSWITPNNGEFWLHPSFRYINSMDYNHNHEMETLFCSCLKNAKALYITRAKRIKNSNTQKHPLLAKLEAICKKNNLKINQAKNEQNEYKNLPTIQKLPLNLHIPERVSTNAINRLMNNPEEFFARDVLGLVPQSTIAGNLKGKVSHAFIDIFRNYFTNREYAERRLEEIKDLDFFSYQKGLRVLGWLASQNTSNCKHNISGEAEINKFGFSIYGFCDMVGELNNFTKITFFQTRAIQSTHDIIHGIDNNIMATCLLSKYMGFDDITKPIHEIEIWSTVSSIDSPVEVKTIEISQNIIDNFEEKLHDVVTRNCNIGNDNIPRYGYDKYIHFKRG